MRANIWLVIGFVLGLAVANCAHADEELSPQAKNFIDNTSGVVLIRVNKEPRVFIFVSKKGEESDILFDQCEHVPACAKLASDLHAAGKADIIDIETAPSTTAAPAKKPLDLRCEQYKELVMPEQCGTQI